MEHPNANVPPQPAREKAAQVALSLQDSRRTVMTAAAGAVAVAAALLAHRRRCRS
ncbi:MULTISPECIES: hypothetical protein [unclassified Streptomyces]|uniref:hypothetical protein n=1 Tax=unclassified Streptomyces TaxID=2593676 RepID=UPI002E334E21|nr:MULTISPECIES: hypothetical protein [unclassified Streptomyces]WUC63252.1 hypothetical protein OG861_02930 [Streptomyces sp. NBC_00539]